MMELPRRHAASFKGSQGARRGRDRQGSRCGWHSAEARGQNLPSMQGSLLNYDLSSSS